MTEAQRHAEANARAIMEQLPFGATREEVEAVIRTGLLLAFELGGLHAEVVGTLGPSRETP